MASVNNVEGSSSAPKSNETSSDSSSSSYVSTEDDQALHDKYPGMTDEEIREEGWKQTWPTAGKPEEWLEKLKKMAKASREPVY